MPRWRIVEEPTKTGSQFFVEEREVFLWIGFWTRVTWPNKRCGYRAFSSMREAKSYIDAEMQGRIALARQPVVTEVQPTITEYDPWENNKTITR